MSYNPTIATIATPESLVADHVALEASAGFRLARLARVRRERWAGHLRELGLTPPQAAIMRATREHQGQALRAVARTLNTDVMSVKRCVDELENRGWITTSTREDDRRMRVVNLTTRGEDLMVRLDALARAHENNLRERLGEAHYALLIDLIDSMERAEGIGSHDDSPLTHDTSKENL